MEEKKQPATLFGYRFFYVFLVSAVFYLGCYGRLPLRDMIPLHLFIMAVLAAAISALDSMRSRNYLYVLIVCVGIYAGVTAWQNGAEPETMYGIFFRETGFLMAVVLAVYLGHLLTEKILWLKYLVALLLLAALAAAMIGRRQIPHLGVAAALLYLLAVLTEWIESGWKKQKQGSREAYLLRLLPFLTGYFILTAAMPYQEMPYDWAFFIKLYGRIQEKVIAVTENVIYFGNEDFGISTTGFSEESGFFGNHGKNDKAVMVIDNPNRYDGNIYLTGKCYNSFDGRKWEQTAQAIEGDCYLDTEETLRAVNKYDGQYPGDYLRKGTIGIQYKHFHTGYLFAPLKTYEIKTEDGGPEFVQQNGSFLFAKRRGYGTGYRVSFYRMNLANPVFAGLVLAIEEQQPEETSAYAERIKEDYTEEIALSPETAAFLREALAGAETDYEKLLRIEAALNQIAYNENPGRLPEWVKTKKAFLDYFLMESREGYCSYYATAFVLLARKEGIPARYVQGYCVPLNGSASVEVREQMAHAWPEVWLEGLGWVPFEPTPGFFEQSRSFWKEHSGGAKKTETSGTEQLENKNETAVQESEEALEMQIQAANRERKRELMHFLGYFLVSLLAVGILLLTVDALWEKRCAAKRSAAESFRMEALRNLQILSALGYRRRRHETLSELGGKLAEQEGLDIAMFIAVCEEVLYGGRIPDQNAAAELASARGALLDKLKERKGKAYLLSRIGLYLMRKR